MDIQKLKDNKPIKDLLEFGIINIDKSSGPTSFTVSEFIGKQLGLRKTSHFGTLDPRVGGVLPIALNRACKLTGYFLGHDKEYVGIARFHKEVNLKEVEKMIKKKFLGKIQQTPPLKSRVKRQERTREIYEFELIEQSEDKKDVLFRVSCEGGTYIRKLIDDLGKELGIGAHMLELRRMRAGIFEENNKEYPSINLYDFEKAVEAYKKGNEKLLRDIITPAEIITKVFPVVLVKESEVKRLYTGKLIFIEDVVEAGDLKPEQTICVFAKDRFIGMYKTILKNKTFAKAEFVLQPIKNGK